MTEYGWGEFDIQMQIHFADPTEPAVEVVFPLRLYPESGEQLQVKKPVVYERYDEIVFHMPSDLMKQKLSLPSKGANAGWAKHPFAELWQTYDPAAELTTLTGLQDKMDRLIDGTAKRKLELEAEVKRLHSEIAQLETKMR